MSTLDRFDLSVGAAAVITVSVVVLMLLVYNQNVKLNRLLSLREQQEWRYQRREGMSVGADTSGGTTDIEVEEETEDDAEEVEAGND